VTIHHTDPFATPEGERSPGRRLRGRLPAPVTLWTAPGMNGPVGLTVSSTVIADGEPARVLGLLDEESDLWAAVEARGVFAVTVLTPADRQLADRFAGLMPAPGGLFQGYRWRETAFGPVPEEPRSWAGCRLEPGGVHPVGWSLLVEASIEQVELTDSEPLTYYRGRYRSLQ
jgi:3-hydroxy-9,10-secoandrosta-1,3,5(10)-triene-9,17-dione monooxygenase reductase component